MYTEEDKDTSLVDNTTELEKHKSFDLVHTSKAQEAKKEVQTDSHIIPLEELFARYGSDPENGLTSAKHQEHLERDGKNLLTPPKTIPSLVKFLEHLLGGFSALLWLGAFLCFIGYMLDSSEASNLYLGVVLVLVVVITAVFSHYQDSKASKVMDKFKNMIPPSATVIRDGEQSEVPAEDLTVGDIVKVKTGQKVPADIRLLEVANMKVDNSSLTGESEPLPRTIECTDERFIETKNIAFYTTFCKEGTGTGIVIATGDRSYIGTIASLASNTEAVETPIHKEINHFIKIISTIAIILGIIFFIFGLFVYDIISNVVFCIGIIVANVPEGLLATVTVSLTLTSKKMAKKNVLVKNLESVETLGSTSTICSDKTGTLTQNKMTVVHIWIDGKIETTDTETSSASFDGNSDAFKALHQICGLCNRAYFPSEADAHKPPAQRRTEGDGSESALIKFVQPIRDIMEHRGKNPVVCKIPFNSANKYQVDIIDPEDGGPYVLLMKGAPERIWKRCSTILVNGQELPLDDNWVAQCQAANDELGSNAERVLGFCRYELPPDQYPKGFEFDSDDPNFPLEGLCFVGLTGLMDPPRGAVPGAVETCQAAKIKVIMVTGDQPITAWAIAKQVGIIRSPTVKEYCDENGGDPSQVTPDQARAIVISGDELEQLSDEELDRALSFPEVVFARTSPQQKSRIVGGCQKRGEIVAVTGDGVNDSPALKKADIGIAMGITGSEVAQEAADMILLDDNFASIVKGVEEGRLIFDNLKKSIAYTLSSNIPEITPFVLFILFRIPLPLSTVLILCVDLGTDLIPAISLAYEKAEADIMKRKPRNSQTDKLVTAKLISFAYLQIGVIQALAGMYTYFVVMGDFGYSPFELPGTAELFGLDGEGESLTVDSGTYSWEQRVNALGNAQTSYFVSIVVVQWADLVICKTRKLSLFQQGMRNMMLNFGIAFETVLCLFVVYIPFSDVALQTRPLHPRHFLPALPFAYVIICYDELRKFWIRTYPNGWIKRFTYY
mmetsp:Transcript_875/g.1102  ORF Transcript_875/g.1102 Transcript_875/m.1102 type:complete len:1011 (-) Transcript_875:34-3066(-)